MSQVDAISVTRLVRRMKNLLEIELGDVWVEGEVSNLKIQASGHHYFTLKDEGGQIAAVLFRGNASKLKFTLKDGMQIAVFAEASLYEARGTVQLIIRKVEKTGEGNLQKQFEERKAKLAEEGLFDKGCKKSIPAFPLSIGLITSETTAALQDMLNVLKRRAPWVQAHLSPVQVQGKGAEVAIADVIHQWSVNVDDYPAVDLIIIARGGGSIEDLWNFNEEVVARAIHASRIPIISGIGHEIDFTIADFVADLRAPTPSAAMELAVPDGDEINRTLEVTKSAIERVIKARLESCALNLEVLKQKVFSKSPDALLREMLLKLEAFDYQLETNLENGLLDKKTSYEFQLQRFIQFNPSEKLSENQGLVSELKINLEKSLIRKLEEKESSFTQMRELHNALGPKKAFARGFTLTKNSKGEVIKDPNELAIGEEISTQFLNGKISSSISDVTLEE